MVKRGYIPPPVYAAAIGAALSLYGYAFFSVPPRVLVIIAFLTFVALSLTVASRPFINGRIATPRAITMGIATMLGILAGVFAAARIGYENRSPVSLIPLDSAASITVTLLEDPAPYGARYYRARARAESIEGKGGMRGSVTGECIIAIPAEIVHEGGPGSLRVTGGDAVRLSSGLRLACAGRFAPMSGESREARLFIVDGQARRPVVALGWRGALDRARAHARRAFERTLYDWGDAGGFFLALASGNRDWLNKTLATDFKRCGLAHVLALSGTHLSLLSVVVSRSGKRFVGKRHSAILSIFAMVAFVWFAGNSPSLDRAFIFAILAFLAASLALEARMLPLLAATSLVQMFLNPRETISLAFILSVTALWGIMTFGDGLLDLLGSAVPKSCGSDFAASFGAQLMTAPVLSFTIGVIAPSGLIASCIIAPISSVFLVAGTALLSISSVIPALSGVCGFLLEALYRCIAIPAHYFARFPVLETRVLPVAIAASIIPLALGISLTILSGASSRRRSSHGDFTRL